MAYKVWFQQYLFAGTVISVVSGSTADEDLSRDDFRVFHVKMDGEEC